MPYMALQSSTLSHLPGMQTPRVEACSRAGSTCETRAPHAALHDERPCSCAVCTKKLCMTSYTARSSMQPVQARDKHGVHQQQVTKLEAHRLSSPGARLCNALSLLLGQLHLGDLHCKYQKLCACCSRRRTACKLVRTAEPKRKYRHTST